MKGEIDNSAGYPAVSPIKILHIVLSLNPGGMENGLVNVANKLHRNGFEISVCCLERKGDFAERLADKSKVFVLNKPQGVSFKTAVRLARLIRKLKPHIVHTHNFGPLIYACMAKFLSPGFILFHGEHGMIKKEDSGRFKILLRRFCYKHCDLAHTVSDGLRNYFVQKGFPAEKIISIKNGVDTARFTPGDKLEARREIGNLESDAIVLGIVGRFDSGKRHLDLIEAFTQLAPEHPELFLLMVGDGGTDCQRVTESVLKNPYKERIIMAGYQKNIVPYYRAMDLLVIPSLKEGFPNVLLESMACGVPALAHPTPGTVETIDSGIDGIVTNLEKIEYIRSAIKLAIKDVKKLQTMGEKARGKIVKNFSLDSMAQGYANVYKMLLGKNFRRKNSKI